MARSCHRDVLPFSAMAAMECVTVGISTLFKSATLRGMSYFVFLAYSYAVATAVLLPASFVARRSRVMPPSLHFSTTAKIVLLSLLGYLSNILGVTGISFSSPTLASVMSNLVPVFTFLLAIIFRMEKLTLRSRSSIAKVLGTVVSIAGAIVVTLYRGPLISIIVNTTPIIQVDLITLQKTHDDSSWVTGGLLFFAQYTLVPFCYIVLAQILKEYPDVLTVTFLFNLCLTIIGAVVGLSAERQPSAWELRTNIALACILFSGIGSFLFSTVHSWALHLKGPLYVAMFKPFSIPIAVTMGVIFLDETLHLGSLVGATIISTGFYIMMWGKAKEEIDSTTVQGIHHQGTSLNTPLLGNYNSGTENKSQVNE